MRRVQQNHLDMLSTVLVHMESAKEVWSNNTLIKEEYNALKNLVNSIQKEQFKQVQRDTRGFTQMKNAQFDLVVTLTLKLVAKMRPFGRKTNNALLLQAIEVTNTSLYRFKSTTAISKCQIVIDKANEHFEELNSYMVTRENITELQEAINKYQPMTAQRNTIGDIRATATSNISNLLNDARLHIQNLDDLISTQLDEQDFITTYYLTKKIGTARGRKVKPNEPQATNSKENK